MILNRSVFGRLKKQQGFRIKLSEVGTKRADTWLAASAEDSGYISYSHCVILSWMRLVVPKLWRPWHPWHLWQLQPGKKKAFEDEALINSCVESFDGFSFMFQMSGCRMQQLCQVRKKFLHFQSFVGKKYLFSLILITLWMSGHHVFLAMSEQP